MHNTRPSRVGLAVLTAAALALIATNYLGGSGLLRSIGGTVFGPAERGVRSLTSPVAGFFERGAGVAGGTARVHSLERELIRLKAQLSTEQVSKREYAQLARLLRLPSPGRQRIIAADVVGVGPGYERAVTLDVGSKAGVRPAETVLNASGLVGTVTSVSPWTSTVRLATDPAAVTGVRLAGSGRLGWVTGRTPGGPGQEQLVLHVLGPGNAVAIGQKLVTAASLGNRPYVAGVPVGVVTGVASGAGLTTTALVRPFADFSALEVVAVIAPDLPGSLARRSHGQLRQRGAEG